MIIGKGLIAKSLYNIDSDEYIFFASGVSNSMEDNAAEFERELDLVKSLISIEDKILVYFSSCMLSVDNPLLNSYYLHKQNIEKIIINNFNKYLILRLPQVIGISNNNNTLINNFIKKINGNEKIVLQKYATRYFLDVDDLVLVLGRLVEKNIYNQVLNIFYPKKYSIYEIILSIESCLRKQSNHIFINEGYSYEINNHKLDNDIVSDIFLKDSYFDYLENCINKYYLQ